MLAYIICACVKTCLHKCMCIYLCKAYIKHKVVLTVLLKQLHIDNCVFHGT